MFRRSPSIKILCFASIGFIFAKLVGFSLFGLIVFSFYFFVLSIVISSISRSKTPVFLFFAILLGIFTSIRTQNLDYSNKSECITTHNGYFYGNIVKVITNKHKYSRLIVDGKILNDEWVMIRNTRFFLTLINSKFPQLRNIDENDILSGAIKFRKPINANLPNEFNELNYLRNLGCELTAVGYSNKIALISVNRPPEIQEQIKHTLFNRIDKLYSPATSGIVKAILLGDKSNIHRETRREFAVSGVAHILAVSGFHVGIIAGILFWIFSFFRNNSIKFLMITVTLAGYIYLVDFQASAVRAGIMIVLFLFSYLIQRKPNPINIIATTILLVAVFHPVSLYSAGFQMSIAAITGIFLLYKPFVNFFNHYLRFDKHDILKKIGNSLAVSLSASLIVSPIVAYYFGIYSIISPLANLVVIPFMFLGQIFGIVALISSYIYYPLGHIYANTSQLSIEIANYLTHQAANLPFSHISGEMVVIISILISLVLVYIFTSNSSKKLLFRLFVVLIIGCLLIANYLTKQEPKYIVYERPNCFLIEQKPQKTIILIGKKECRQNWEDYGLLNYLKNKNYKLKIYNVSTRMRYDLWKNKIKYKKESAIQINKHLTKLL